MHIIVFFLYLTNFYLILTFITKLVVGDFFQNYFIGSYQKHLEGFVLNVHIASSVIMFLIFSYQKIPKTSQDVRFHKILGYVFVINIVFFVFSTSMYLTLFVKNKWDNIVYHYLLKILFLESAYGVLVSTICSYYSIAYLKNVRLHMYFNKICLSYSSTPILDRFCIMLCRYVMQMDYDQAHLCSLIILSLNMMWYGFFLDFIFISKKSKETFKFLHWVFRFRWIYYVATVYIFGYQTIYVS
jgi:hypothetical protein